MNISTWFKTKNYKEGVALLASLGASSVLIQFLQIGENTLSKRKLEVALTEIQKKEKAVHLATPQKAAIAQGRSISASDSSDAPKEIKLIVEERISLYNASRAAHERLKLMAKEADKFTNEQRAAERKFIIQSFNRIKHIWKETDYYDKNLTILPKIEISPDITFDANALIKRRNALRSYLTPSYRARLHADKIAVYEKELAGIEKQLEDAI